MRLDKALFNVSAALALFALPIRANNSTQDDSRLRSTAMLIADLELRRQLPSATPATIDSLLALYSDSVVYEHPNARAVIRGKAVMRRNMSQYMGSIRAIEPDKPQVTVGHGVAIVESRVHMEVADGGKWVPLTRHGIRVIEFEPGGLVRRIIDYPW